ncbi:fumarylacetoacetate hydrolase family protein [Niveomyces insectorum RCEF 264]|uniref:Fumarylacetoacetate hydrolase family protein n=1 Tax=Niveomyces insectorum RCEF 264 TaxID=1081102 RepID=A0A162I990_9HYPO|nr:fumarylacetoacetate hydrolase family protein [Niveomyces insectorum RCEF 264]
MPSFSRLIRFLATDGRTYYGDALLPKGVTDIAKTKQARVVVGDIFGKHEVTDEIVDVRLLLSPLAPEDVRTSLSGPTDPIPVPLMAQEGAGLDYECELVAVIGKKCANVPEARALDFVLGYAVGNDISHRDWQLKRGGGQWSLGKGFDGWAPWGPGIVSRDLITNPQSLNITTRVNGDIAQQSDTSDMIFSVRQAVSFLSQGTTLLPGDVIFTGTPQGVGMGRKPPVWLKDGDVVEVELENVGTCTNAVQFVTATTAKL